MRAGDLAVPLTAPHTIPPDAPIAAWPLGLHIALEQLPESAYTWDDATTGTWDGAGFVWDAPFTAADHRDVTCDFHTLDIDAGTPDDRNLYPPTSATLTLANPAGIYTPWTADGRMVYWAPGRRLAVWTEAGTPTADANAPAWNIVPGGVVGNFLRTQSPVTDLWLNNPTQFEVVVRAALADWDGGATTFDGFAMRAGNFILRRSGTRQIQLVLYWGTGGADYMSTTATWSAGALAPGQMVWWRVRVNADTGAGGWTGQFQYNTADQADEPATGWATPSAPSTGTPNRTIRHTTGPVVIGQQDPTRTFFGRIARVIIRNGIAPAPVIVDVGEADVPGDLANGAILYPKVGPPWLVQQVAGSDLIRPGRPPGATTWQVWFPATAGNMLTITDAPALNMTGDLDIWARIAPDKWSSGTNRVIACKDIIPGQAAPRSWIFRLTTTGALQLLVSTTGTSHINAVSTSAPPVADGAAVWVRVVRVATTGVMSFFYAPDSAQVPPAASWVAIGTGAPGTGNMTNGAWPVTIGARTGGAGDPFAGRILRVIVRPGSGYTPIVLDLGESDFAADLNNDDTFRPLTGPAGFLTQAAGADVIRPGPIIPALTGRVDWLFAGRVAGWERAADGTVTVTAYDGLAELAQDMPKDWSPGVDGQTVKARIASVGFAAGYADPLGGDTGHVTLSAPLSDRSALEEIEVAALSDGGLFYADPDGELIYRDRYWRQGRADQPKVWQVSDNVCDAGVVVWDTEAAADDDGLATYVELVNAAGLRAIARADTYWTSARYRLTHPDPDLWQTQGQGDALANYLISTQSTPAMSVGAFTLYLSDPNQPQLWSFATTTRRGDTVNVVHDYLDATGAPARLDLYAIVTGLDHNISPDGWTTTVHLSRSVDAVPLERWDVTGWTWDFADKRNVWRF